MHYAHGEVAIGRVRIAADSIDWNKSRSRPITTINSQTVSVATPHAPCGIPSDIFIGQHLSKMLTRKSTLAMQSDCLHSAQLGFYHSIVSKRPQIWEWRFCCCAKEDKELHQIGRDHFAVGFLAIFMRIGTCRTAKCHLVRSSLDGLQRLNHSTPQTFDRFTLRLRPFRSRNDQLARKALRLNCDCRQRSRYVPAYHSAGLVNLLGRRARNPSNPG